MSNPSKLRFLVQSPLPLLIFIVIPAALIFSTVLKVPLPFRITQRMLLLNNVFLLLFIAARLLHYLSGLRRAIRYGEAGKRPDVGMQASASSAAQIREGLSKRGFHWNAEGGYGEKPDRGYLGTLLIYGGLFLLLFIGTWENLNQFSGTLLHGIGIPADLSNRGSYAPLSEGILASTTDLPKLEVTKQIFASSAYHKGASEVTLWPKDGNPIRTTLVGSGEPYQYKGFDIYLAKQLVDVALNIKSKSDRNQAVFYDSVKFSPLWKKEGDYSMYGAFRTPAGHEGEAFYSPEKKTFKFAMTLEGKTVLDTEYVLHQYREKEVGDFVMSLDAMGNWSELHVVRRRHMELLWVGGAIALLGAIMRIAIRPRRVWLEESPEGCRVWGLGKEGV